MKRASEEPNRGKTEHIEKDGLFEDKRRRVDKPASIAKSNSKGKTASSVAEVYEQHVKDAERDRLDAKQKGDIYSVARLTEHVHNLKKHGIEGFEKFKECGSYSFATLKSDEEDVDSEDSSTVSALSSGGGKWINNTASDK